MPPPSRRVTTWPLQLLVTWLWIFREAEAVVTLQQGNVVALHAWPSKIAAPSRSPVSEHMTTGINVHLQQRRATISGSPGGAAFQVRAGELAHRIVAAEVHALHAPESSNSSWLQPSGTARTDIAGKSTHELLQRFPQGGNDVREPLEPRDPLGERVEADLERSNLWRQKGLFIGLPKVFWAVIADVFAMGIFVMCIPLTLYVAKRRRPAQSSS